MSAPGQLRPMCVICKHLEPQSGMAFDAKMRCKAFPDGIPSEIWDQALDHREPYADEKITFELDPASSDGDLASWLEARAEMDLIRYQVQLQDAGAEGIYLPNEVLEDDE